MAQEGAQKVQPPQLVAASQPSVGQEARGEPVSDRSKGRWERLRGVGVEIVLGVLLAGGCVGLHLMLLGEQGAHDVTRGELAREKAAKQAVTSEHDALKTQVADLQLQEFERYHNLIRDLVVPAPETKVIWLDRQIAVAFELRHFPRYYELSARVLSGLKEQWSAHPQSARFTRLLQEMELTLEHIKSKI